MPFNIRHLANNGGSSGAPRLWSYSGLAAGDLRAAVIAVGYFNQAANHLRVGDLVYVHCSDGMFFTRCTAIAAGVVTMAAQANLT